MEHKEAKEERGNIRRGKEKEGKKKKKKTTKEKLTEGPKIEIHVVGQHVVEIRGHGTDFLSFTVEVYDRVSRGKVKEVWKLRGTW